MELKNARYVLEQGYPGLAVEVDGRPALLACECKPIPFEAGLTFLGPEFADELDEFDVTSQDGTTTRLTGFSDDVALHRLYATFLQAADGDDFAEGPVAIPA